MTTIGRQSLSLRSGVLEPNRSRNSRSGRLRWWREAALVLVLSVAYDTARGLHRGSVTTATNNAQAILRFEHDVHLDPERWLNQGLHQLPALAVLAAYFYATLHYIVTPAVLVWMYRSHPNAYRHARSWLATATVAGLAVFWLYPVTPPRLLPNSPVRDTLADAQGWGWWSAHSAAPNGLGSLVNEYAAMPSLHVGWALWCGWLVVHHAHRNWVRVLGTAYPALTALVVMGTGNHYLLDAVAGAALVALTERGTSLLLRQEQF